MQYGEGRHIADLRELRQDKTLQKAAGLKSIPSGWKKEQMSLFELEEYFYHVVATKMEVDAEVVIKIHNKG